MKKFISGATTWLRGLFDTESTVSSKRFIAIAFALWVCGLGGYYIVAVQFGGPESTTSVGLIEFIAGSAVSIAVGGTAAEAAKKLAKDKNSDS